MAHIRSENVCNGPHGLTWSESGAVQEVTDVKVIADLLRIPGFSEVLPDDAPKARSTTKNAKSFTEVSEDDSNS